MAYFDNAATTFPKPEVVYSFMTDFYKHYGANVGRGNYKEAQTAGTLIKETRSLISEVLNCPLKQVIFTPTATIALNIVIQGVIVGGARNIYIGAYEHNAVTRTLKHFELAGKINVHTLAVNPDHAYNLTEIQKQFNDIAPDFVIVSHASNVTGMIAPIEEIFSLAKMYKATTLVDMAQTAGLVEINVGNSDIDFAVFAGHKTLYGPTGISGFVMKKDLNIPAVIFGGTGYESANQNMPESLPEKYEMGTLNIAGIAGLNASLKWLKDIGINRIWDEEQENRNRLLYLLKNYWFIKIVGVNDSQKYVGIVSCLIQGISSDSAGEVFSKKGIAVRTGLQCAPKAHEHLGTFPAGTIRFSTSYFTTDKDFEDLEKALDYIEDNL